MFIGCYLDQQFIYNFLQHQEFKILIIVFV